VNLFLFFYPNEAPPLILDKKNLIDHSFAELQENF